MSKSTAFITVDSLFYELRETIIAARQDLRERTKLVVNSKADYESESCNGPDQGQYTRATMF
jgi:hypothetical protein